MTATVTIRQPDDFHLHLRDGEIMKLVVQDSAEFYRRALVMPNLSEPVVTVEKAVAYRQRILDSLPEKCTFEPLMTLYLTPHTKPEQIVHARESGVVLAVKYYPAGATTNSAYGVVSIEQCRNVLETMQKIGLPLSIHGEVTDSTIDIFDREKVFIDTVLSKIQKEFPELKIVLEHVSTKEGIQFVSGCPQNVAATITAHHLLLNRNDLLAGGINPHLYCLPIVKTEEDRQAVSAAATSGNPKFFLGTDSAPHLVSAKIKPRGAAGIYAAYQSLPIYAELFERMGHLDKLENFASHFGSDFYGLPRNRQMITLTKQKQIIPAFCGSDSLPIVPLKQNETISWSKSVIP